MDSREELAKVLRETDIILREMRAIREDLSFFLLFLEVEELYGQISEKVVREQGAGGVLPVDFEGHFSRESSSESGSKLSSRLHVGKVVDGDAFDPETREGADDEIRFDA
ncbi:hypothetical protein GOV11_04920 [Candidatus Woesearchaeota archaeon]|nr:hypothetical protein [Candidatus Woesearchaeota archaeon]